MRKDRLGLSIIVVVLGIILLILLTWKFILPWPQVCVQKTGKGKFQLLVKGRPYLVKGVVYHPIPIGQNHQYNFWADPHQPWIEDGRLMQEAGINTVRFFQPGPDAAMTRRVIGQLYKLFGIRTIMGDWMDYWNPGDYADEQYRRELTARIIEVVKTYKDEPGILMWVLGNENNLSWHSRALVPWRCVEADKLADPYEKESAKAKIYYSLVNQIAREIKKLDRQHPVALGNADTYALELAKEVCPDIDLVAVTAYRGKSFGNLWREARRKIGKPVLIMEFGCDSFNAQNAQEDQQLQAVFLKTQWEDILRNSAGGSGEGNALGGCVFEWNDEWWKHDEQKVAGWDVHNTEGDWSCGAYYFDIGAPSNLNINEEWWGIVALSEELKQGLNQRLPRKAYYELQKLWKVE